MKQSSSASENWTEREFAAAGGSRVNKAARRNRGEIACAECRRLKIRCDKTVPCSTCVKRGCTALCPNGTIPPGDGSRFVLAATDHLRKKMTKLEARMRSLEDAIAILHANKSDQPHPLLVSYDEDEEDIDEPTLRPVIEEEGPSVRNDTFGALHVDNRGGVRFFGPSGGSESLLLQAKELEGQLATQIKTFQLEELDTSYFPTEIRQCYMSFPFSPPGIMTLAVQPMIESFLPSIDRAIELCNTFLEHLSWMFQIVSRQQMVDDLIPRIYKKGDTPTYGPHDLALLLIVLGIGTLVDLNLEPYSLEAQHYYKLTCATLALQSVLEAQSVVTVKVVHLMQIYNGMCGKESNLEQCYALMDLATQIALNIGLHIDPGMWGFQGKDAYDRRVYFWNLMSGSLWQSITTGRPPVLLTTHIDCKIPTFEDEMLYQHGEVPLGFGVWGFRASIECLIPLTKMTLAVKPTEYPALLELDKKIRNLIRPQGDNPHAPRTAISMQAFVRSHYTDLMLLFLHRGFFAQALSEYPVDPLRSPYGESVLASYSSACVVLDDTKLQYKQRPVLISRIWQIWTFTFPAAVVVGTMAIRGQHLDLKPSPLEEFESTVAMFASAAEISNRAARGLPVLQAMLQKAHQAQYRYRQKYEPVLPNNNTEDELSVYGGKTRLVSDKTSDASTPPSQPSSIRQSASPGYPIAPAQMQSEVAGFPGYTSVLGLDGMDQNLQATFADLTRGWNGLFHEVQSNAPRNNMEFGGGPGMDYSSSRYGSGEAPMMVDDRWPSSSFMHNYNVYGDSMYPHNNR